jgi:hypothetical protein
LNLTVTLPSRGRPFGLQTVIETLQRLESGRHTIRYVLGVDADDPQSVSAAWTLWAHDRRVIPWCRVRRSSLGEMVNEMTAAHPADAYVALCDDVDILTEHWDEAIHQSWKAEPNGVWWWKTLKQRPATYPVISEGWRKASGKPYTDYFCFWWDDMWLMQVWMMASQRPALWLDAALDDRAQNTQRMRDLRFWANFYTKMKPERQKRAAFIAQRLGWPVGDLEEHLCDVSPEFLAKAEAIERFQGEVHVPPTPEYVRAYQRAAAL